MAAVPLAVADWSKGSRSSPSAELCTTSPKKSCSIHYGVPWIEIGDPSDGRYEAKRGCQGCNLATSWATATSHSGECDWQESDIGPPLAIVISCLSRASCIFSLPDANVESEGGTADRWYRRLLHAAWATRDLQLPSIARYLRPGGARRQSRAANRG